MSPRAVTLVPYTPAAHLLYHHCCCCCNCCTDAATYVCPVCTGSCAAAVTSRPNISILEPSPSLPGFRNFSFRSVKLKTVKTFLDVHLKKKDKMTKIQAKNRVRDVTAGILEICETHRSDLKKQGEKRFPSQFHRSNFFSEFYEKRNSDRY